MSKKIKKLVVLTLFLGSGLLQAMESNNDPTDSPSSIACECEECSFTSWPKRKTSLPSPSSIALKKLKEKGILQELPITKKEQDISSPRSNFDAEKQLGLVVKCLKKKEK
jgi:hypothetical protein